MGHNILAPSILAADCADLRTEIQTIEAEGAEYVHIDVMDGVFVPSLSFGIPVVESVRKITKLVLDVHLMIIHPLKYIKQFAEAGADSITFHMESGDDPDEVIEAIRAAGCRVGISIRPGTPIEDVYKYLDKVDMLLIMTVEPGFGGQKYIEASTARIAQARYHINSCDLKADIEVDGGITEETVRTVIEVGANVIVAGSAIFHGDTAANCRRYVDILNHTGPGEVL
ncbi:MAG: ribulose-phosphate 3-epimerase [Lachnospiraceae bacterium]|nr:ribulose-phosphate 3-epimerase [Lachnospiraceae bacterium]